MFISAPVLGLVYAAEPSSRGSRFLWWLTLLHDTNVGPHRVDASEVPLRVRKRAYAYFYNMRKEHERAYHERSPEDMLNLPSAVRRVRQQRRARQRRPLLQPVQRHGRHPSAHKEDAA